MKHHPDLDVSNMGMTELKSLHDELCEGNKDASVTLSVPLVQFMALRSGILTQVVAVADVPLVEVSDDETKPMTGSEFRFPDRNGTLLIVPLFKENADV